MSDDDPFAEPDDTDRTVIRPNPGGRRSAAAPARPAAPFAPQAAAGGDSFGVPPSGGTAPAAAARAPEGQLVMTGMNQLNACASPLFALISRVRNRAQHVDPDKLRQNVVAEVRAFENRALQAGIDAQEVKVARYAICATLDDVVLNTPWGEQSSWAMQSMVGTFHRETVGGDRFYDLLARLEQDPGKNINLLEFMYNCLSLGFEGRLRVEDRGADRHLQIRNSLAAIIRGQRGPVEHDLSPRWKGLTIPHRVRSIWRPVWIAVGVTAALLATSFAGLSWGLSRTSQNVVGQLSVLDTGIVPVLERRAPPPPPAPPPPEVVDKVAQVSGFLDAEIKEGIVSVFENGNTLTIRLAGAGMFGSGSDSLKDAFKTPIARVAEALKGEEGPIIIAGHSDNVPIKSSRFKDNAALSLARAQAVLDFMSDKLDNPSRMTAEGRADKEPIADNSTKEGRAQNRRIEILLVKVDN